MFLPEDKGYSSLLEEQLTIFTIVLDLSQFYISLRNLFTIEQITLYRD